MNAAATVCATTFSTITLQAASAQTSLRSYAARSASFVFRLIESSGFRSVLIGFIAARTTRGWPFVIPASSPPALFVPRT